MSIIDAINQNTNAVTSGKMRLKAAINNNGGSVSQAGTVPTFQELIDGLTGVTGSGVNTSVSGDTLRVSAMSNISAGSVVKILTNTISSISYDLSEMLPTTANVDGNNLTMYKTGQSYLYASCYTPVLSKSAQMMVGFYRSSTDIDVLYAVPFFKVDGAWKQMTVNGKYTAAHRRTQIQEFDYQSYMFYYDDGSGSKLAVIGDTVFSVDEANLNIDSKHTIDIPIYTYINKTYIYGSLIVIDYYWYASSFSQRGHYTVVYHYDIATRQSTLLSQSQGNLLDVTTNGKDVFVLTEDFYIRKYSIGNDNKYTEVGSLKIPDARVDGSGWQEAFLARGCTAAVACDGGNIDYSLDYYEIDPESLTFTNSDVDVIFPSENVIIERATKDFNYLLVEYGKVSSLSEMYIWERTVDSSTGKIKYINKGTLEAILNDVTETSGLVIETPQFLFESLNHILITVGNRANYHQNKEITLSGDRYFYSAIGSNFLNSYEDVVATGYALEDIPFGHSGLVKVTSYVYGAEQEIKQSSAYVNSQLDDINGETV